MMAPHTSGDSQRRALASRVGQMMFSGGIFGTDPETGITPEDVDLEVSNCFSNLRRMLAEAGGSLGDVGQVTVLVRDHQVRRRLRAAWSECFPDAYTQPARQTIVVAKLQQSIRLEVVAVLKA